MAAKVLNIEVGDRIIKVCVSARHGKKFQILDSFMFQTPEMSVTDGQIANPEAVAEALKEALASRGNGEVKNVVFTLTSAKVATREVMLPPVKDNRIKTVVETNASEYFPVDMSTYRISCNLLERVGGETPGCRVLVMAAPRQLLESYVRLAEAAGLQLDAVDFCGNSQYQVLRGIQDDGVVMYVDVNVTNTFVTFMKSGILLLQRNFSVGGDELITAALHAAGRSDKEYLKTMQDAGDPAFLGGLLTAEQQSDCLSRLVSGIVRSADFFKSDHTDLPATKVVLMGTCSHLAGLREMIGHEIGLDTVLLHDVAGIQFVANSAEGVSSYISCIGSLVAPLDLLPEELLAQKRKKQKKTDGNPIRTGIVICVACILAGAAISAFSIFRYLDTLSRRDAMQSRIDSLSSVDVTYNTYVLYKQTDENLTAVGDYAKNPNAGLTAFLSELEKKMPSSVLVLSATCDDKGVTMNVTAPSMKEAAVVISQLRSFDSIVNIEVSTITETTDETGTTTASFSISCSYEQAESSSGAAASSSGTASQASSGTQSASSAK